MIFLDLGGTTYLDFTRRAPQAPHIHPTTAKSKGPKTMLVLGIFVIYNGFSR